jgi:putative membrane protein
MIVPIALMAALAVAGCSKQEDRNEMAGANAQDVGMNDTDTVDSADMDAVATPDFVTRMAMSDMYEIAAGKIAIQRAKNPEIRKFGEMMVADHGASSAELKKLVADGKLAAPPAMLDDEHNDRLQALRDADAEDFDGVYADQQREAHERAVALLEGYGAGGENASLKSLAQKLLPKVRAHLDRIGALDEGGADDMPAR